ncbi:hypothetical protein JOF35_001383 [Streptomyces demainii]|uniref:Uncharacterized protein n=1 Tax=Streptomyces demainii TaxID=588122 RepID=A0ABT9KL10_9ACTN|nr:hypothetical protein [Streptomyces demainii]MDP9609106.1 hypothetical protein [Streptomyces demainii]
MEDLVTGGLKGDAEAGPVRVGSRNGAGGVGDGDPDHLVGRQQRIDLLRDARQGTGPQYTAAEHGLLDGEIGGLHFPPLVVQPDQLERWAAAVIEQGRGQAVYAGVPPGGGGDGDLALDDADLHGADPGEEGAIVEPSQDGRLARGGEPGQEVGAGVVHGLQEGVGGESPVQQYDHALAHRAHQATPEDGFAGLAGAEDRVDDCLRVPQATRAMSRTCG